MTQKERQERSRREILSAAIEEFGAKEYDKVTMERICADHGISKGMMYHYYSNKDELFLLCVEDTFELLKDYIERHMTEPEKQTTFDEVKKYFTIREKFFEQDLKRKRIFETAILRPPGHLAGEIQLLHEPIRKLNRKFLENVVARMSLREGMAPEHVTGYLESLEPFFYSVINRYQEKRESRDLPSTLENAREILDMVLFGVLRQP